MTGLYIHIPFCKQKCKYCDFNSFSGLEGLFEDYFLCLEKEIEFTAQKGLLFDTVYIGGGTPTAPPNKYLVKLIKSVKNVTSGCEITVECNPGTVTYSDLVSLKNAGANRLSIGLQSTDNEELKMLGRIHSLKDFEACFCNARRAGFDNISVDIMFGLPNQTLKSFAKTLEKAASCGGEHISCYCLKIEEGTPFAKMDLTLPSDDECADMYDYCVNFLKKHGYERYEISNFAKNGKASRHNTKYWLLEDYIGIGAGAHSLYKGKRFSKIPDVRKYIDEILKGNDAVNELNTIIMQEQMSEFVFLGLRMTDGIDTEKFYKKFGTSIYDIFGSQVEKYLKMGVMEEKDNRIFIKSDFLYVSNNILADFI